jgi:hypothetical protein
MSAPTDERPDYSNLVAYLKREAEAETARGKGLLCIVAARAKVSEGELRDIVEGRVEMSDEIANALALVVEPQDDQWALDTDECDIYDIPNLSTQQIVERLRHAQDNGKLGVIAAVSGVKGGEQTLADICHRGGRIDDVTRSLLLNVMVADD